MQAFSKQDNIIMGSQLSSQQQTNLIQQLVNQSEHSLTLNWMEIGDVQLEEIIYLCKQCFQDLEKVSLIGNCISAEQIMCISKLNLNKLVSLDLTLNNIGSKGIQFFLTNPLPNIKSLNLKSNKITEEGCKYLSHVKKIEELYLWDNQIGNQGLNYLSNGQMINLRVLDISCNRIKPLGIKYLACGKLYLCCQGAKYLSFGYFPFLNELNLKWNNIGVKGAIYLTDSCFDKLNLLDISGNQIFDIGIKYLVARKFENLQQIFFYENNLMNEMKERATLMLQSEKTKFAEMKKLKKSQTIHK